MDQIVTRQGKCRTSEKYPHPQFGRCDARSLHSMKIFISGWMGHVRNMQILPRIQVTAIVRRMNRGYNLVLIFD